MRANRFSRGLKTRPCILICALALFLALLLAAPMLSGQAPAQGLTSETLWKWNFVGDAQISPDGTKIA